MTELLFIVALALASILLVAVIGKSEETSERQKADDTTFLQLDSEELRMSNERLLEARVGVNHDLPDRMAEAWQEEQAMENLDPLTHSSSK